MKKLMPLLITFMLLTACQQVPAGRSPAVPTPTPTPTHTPTPTVEPSATPTVAHPEVNPATAATLWPADVQARFKDVLTDPWTATVDEKAAYDTFLTTQWQLTLKADGVANAETLQGYDLLNAIIEHQPPITLTGNETPEQLAAYVVELPFSLHKLLRTDQSNLVGFHHEDGRYVEGKMDPRPNSQPPVEDREPLQKAPNDWGYYDAYYGFGGDTSPNPDHAALLTEMGYLSSTTHPDNYGFNFYGEKIPAIGVDVSLEGDLMFLFRVPGTDPNGAVGAMIRMYDGSRVAYAEVYLPLSNVSTTASDTCLTPVVGRRIQTLPCRSGLSISDLEMEDMLSSIPPGHGSLYVLLKLMSLYKNPHIAVTFTRMRPTVALWKEGIPVENEMYIPNITKGFFTKP